MNNALLLCTEIAKSKASRHIKFSFSLQDPGIEFNKEINRYFLRISRNWYVNNFREKRIFDF